MAIIIIFAGPHSLN